ncbi:MAG: lipoprotein-releasing system ATP-binding protein [Acidobacteriota bacterium]|nr:lipoprotein-releasing system ATP-binding protein [Acidobacteriota bacterium]
MLREVSFNIEAGEMTAIMGASGAGKSTLLHLLGGLEAADDGRIRLNDFEVTLAQGAGLARYRNEDVGFVFQSHHLLPDLSAAENVALPLTISRVAWSESRLRAVEALEAVGLNERASHPVGHLSGGEQQRVALARALIKRPRLVLADEPTGNLDAATGDEIGALLGSYCRASPAIVIIATHNVRLAEVCDRALLLDDGRIMEKQEAEDEKQNPESRIQESESRRKENL